MTQPTCSPISMALFGVGRWGTHWLRNFQNHPDIDLKVVVEPADDRRATLRQQLDDQIVVTGDWQSAMATEGLTACMVATPAATHYELIEAALKRRLHVLAEKPLTLKVDKARSLCEFAQQQNRQLVIDHTYLFHGAVAAGKAALPSMGRPRYGYATRSHLGPVRRDVDALWDLAIHDISIFNNWLGEQPVEVQAWGQGWLQPEVKTPLSPTGLMDVVWCRLRYPSGFEATVHLCWGNPDKQRRLCVVCDRGTQIFDEMNRETPLIQQRGDFFKAEGSFTPQNLSTEVIEVPDSEPLKNVCDHFVQCVRENKPSAKSSGRTGTELVCVLNALTKSLNNDGKIQRV